jgi:hypothetical protein
VQQTCKAAGSLLMSAVATANLGGAAARAGGRADEARELLGTALNTLREIQAARFVYETEVRLAEAAGDHDAALRAADAAAEVGYGALTPSVQACSTASVATRTSKPVE